MSKLSEWRRRKAEEEQQQAAEQEAEAAARAARARARALKEREKLSQALATFQERKEQERRVQEAEEELRRASAEQLEQQRRRKEERARLDQMHREQVLAKAQVPETLLDSISVAIHCLPHAPLPPPFPRVRRRSCGRVYRRCRPFPTLTRPHVHTPTLACTLACRRRRSDSARASGRSGRACSASGKPPRRYWSSPCRGIPRGSCSPPPPPRSARKSRR
jgi:hypothetical protein